MQNRRKWPRRQIENAIYDICAINAHVSKEMPIKERDFMGGLAKGLKVIEAFSLEYPKMTISEVSDIAALDRATTRRCLLTLAQLGYCSYDGKFFTVTPRILRLGTSCLAAMPLPRLVQPSLELLSSTIQQSTSVSVLDEHEIVYVARASQRRVMSIALMPGSRLPAYCTSMGRILLAALDEKEAYSILMKSDRVARTPYTMTEIEPLMICIEKIRQQGYAVIDQEVELGLRSIAVPLLNSRNQTIAALNVGHPVMGETTEEMIAHYFPALKKVQTELKTMIK